MDRTKHRTAFMKMQETYLRADKMVNNKNLSAEYKRKSQDYHEEYKKMLKEKKNERMDKHENITTIL